MDHHREKQHAEDRVATLVVDPPLLLPWLSSQEKLRAVVLLDLEADITGIEALRLDLNVVFNPIPVRRGSLQKMDYYIGTTGAEIVLDTVAGSVTNFTAEQSIDVNYSNTVEHCRKSTVAIKPTLEGKDGGRELKAGFGEFRWEKDATRSFKSAFACQERILSPIQMGSVLRWIINLPRGEKVIRDFLAGNLFLFAECSWTGGKPYGKVSVRPSDVRFFDDERRPLKRMTSIAMLFALWKNGVAIGHKDGLSARFWVE